jgi:hypothetical protein
MGGFTLDDGYVQGVAADAQRFTGSLLDLLLDVPETSSRTQLSLQLNPWYRYRYRCLEQMPIAEAYSREHARGFTLFVDLNLAELRQKERD